MSHVPRQKKSLPEPLLSSMRACVKSIYEYGIDFSAVGLNLIENGINIRESCSLPVTEKMIKQINEVMVKTTLKIRNQFADH